MSFSPYRRPILEQAKTDLTNRLNTYKNGPHYKAAVRNPAFCKLKWSGGEVPKNTVAWNDTYRAGKFQKPAPALQSVNLILGANENTSLSIEAEFAIKIFTKEDFSDTVDSLCKIGMLLTFDWGYDNPFGEGYTGKSITGFKLCGFTFNTEPDGTYIIEGKAQGPSSALKSLSANYGIKKNANRKYINEGKSYEVLGIIELLAYWAQGNGKKSIDDMEDGEVLQVPAAARADGSTQSMGSIIIYDPKHLHGKGFFSAAGRALSAITSTNNELNKTNNIIYYSLETIVGLFNTEVFPAYSEVATTTNSVDFSKLKIEFDEDSGTTAGFSYSYIDPNIRSAYPTKILILDDKLGDYKNSTGAGKNFWEVAKNKSAIKTIKTQVDGRNKVDLKRIFIERSIILAALDGSKEKESAASTIDSKVNREASININDFFGKIFEEIKVATGDRMSLIMAAHPDVFDAKDEKAYTLYIFDETNGYDKQPKEVWEFNPIDGDGTTRAFTIKSDIGSQNFQLSQFAGPTMATDVPARAEGIYAAVDAARALKYKDAVDEIAKLIKNPGPLGDSAFDDIHMQALKGLFTKLKDYEPNKTKFNNMTFIGLGADVELDGIWGIGPGAAIWSTQMPKKYRDNHIFFNVMSTTHKFDGETSDWSTLINGVVSTFDTVNYVPENE